MKFVLMEIALDRDATPTARRDSALAGVVQRMTRFVNSLNGSVLASPRRSAAPPPARPPAPGEVATLAEASTPAARRTRAAAVTASNGSPRRGAKKKQQRLAAASDADVVSRWTLPASIDGCIDQAPSPDPCRSPFRSHGRPTTEFVGWRRLHLEEVVHLEKDDPFILVIPAR